MLCQLVPEVAAALLLKAASVPSLSQRSPACAGPVMPAITECITRWYGNRASLWLNVVSAAADQSCMLLWQATLVVDLVTWGLLWPMLSRSDDPKRYAFWREHFFNITSYHTVQVSSCSAWCT